ncbi:YtxH domain-containing protein [Mucilaginibacter robiniae]|uniref:YtxH domain-containing protein n=1 Tax=Mucilaginibacter robiniae TaxID=2728022 RepID=A0A7L5DTU8_9SPHI|nr:YtxH domain-containing protein [Mucilaginibacter robiniae]QJD94535.1 YtxH domain-containing protein [Mucilaginibacter robiniae]
MKDQTKVIAALLVGAAAGAAIGLLLAPESGSELREDIADYVNDLIEKTKDKAQITADDLKEYSTSLVDKAKTKLNGVVSSANEYKEDAEDAASDVYGAAKSKVKGTASEVNDSIQGA